MLYFEPDQEEQDILKAIDAADFRFRSVPDAEAEKSRYRQGATDMLRKTRNVNIRLSENDLMRLKAKAIKRGLPYQTLIASVLHQYGSR